MNTITVSTYDKSLGLWMTMTLAESAKTDDAIRIAKESYAGVVRVNDEVVAAFKCGKQIDYH